MLSYEELEQVLLEISLGEKAVFVDACSAVLFKYPNNNLRLKAEFIYKTVYNEAVKEGFLPMVELEHIMEERGLFTKEDKNKIENIKNKIKAQEVVLSKITKVKANADKVKNIILRLKNSLQELYYKRNSKLVMSAETKAEDAKNQFLCYNCTLDLYTEHNYWSNFDDFKNEPNLNLKNNILRLFIEYLQGLDTKVLRFIARSSLWRIRYINSQKTGEDLFGTPTTFYTKDQLELVYWSNYYSNIYEMLPEDRPSDDLVEDDQALDAYMNKYYEERTRELAYNKSKQSVGEMSAFDSEEVIITKSNEYYQKIKYNKPREAQKIKDKTDIKKRAVSRKRTV